MSLRDAHKQPDLSVPNLGPCVEAQVLNGYSVTERPQTLAKENHMAEKCENCGKGPVKHYDVEGVPFCQKCWDTPEVFEPTTGSGSV